MIITTTHFLTLLQLFLLIITSSTSSNNDVRCLERERQALLKFKAGLIDEYGQLSSWENGQDCCQWEGIRCANQTNHVIAVSFFGFGGSLRGKMISPALLDLDELNFLDLGLTDFSGSQIPEFIGSLTKLEHLSMKFCNLDGVMPLSLKNLSLLKFLDLSYNFNEGHIIPNTIGNLTSLVHLDLSNNQLQGSIPNFIGNLVSLVHLDLSKNQLQGSIPLALGKQLSLSHLDLSNNQLQGSIPNALGNLVSLVHLDLSTNQLQGSLPDGLGNLLSLSHLDLSNNRLLGSLPNVFGNLSSLSHFDLSNNQLQGEFPDLRLSNLTFLDLSENKLQGELTHLMMKLWNSILLQYIDLSENAFFNSLPNMSRVQYLKELRLNGNHLNGSIGEDNLRLPNLELLDLSRNKLTGRIPDLSSCLSLIQLRLNDNTLNDTSIESIGNLFKLEHLNLGSNHLEGLIFEAHLFNLSKLKLFNLSFNPNLTIRINSSWNPPFQLDTLILTGCNLGPYFPRWLLTQRQILNLDISNLKIVDTIPNLFWNNTRLIRYLNMSHNQLHGALPDLSSVLINIDSLDLSFNQFTGTLPTVPPSAYAINLSRNKLSGTIKNICTFRNLVLDVSNNLLSGPIPRSCFTNLTNALYLNLENNNLSGNIEAKGSSCTLFSLYLRNNSFTGYIPRFLASCSDLISLDLGENKFYGTIPGWLGESMPKLIVLSLKSNHLNGNLPSSLCRLSRIQVLDVSMNKISGTIPKCVDKFTMLSSKLMNMSSTGEDFWGRNWTNFRDSASIMWKGKLSEYINTLWLLKAIDLSSNNLSGEIPHEITTLMELIALNLSRNNLIGTIPHDINRLVLLNFLDLSRNNLSGGIPSTLSQLSHLGVLDLSFNNLSGKIPWDTHMDTFNASSYIGNLELCGPPLVSKPCPEDDGVLKKPKFSNWEDKLKHMLKRQEFYVSTVLGFIISFWGVFGTLYMNKRWNITIVKAFINVEDWLYVKILVNKRRLQMKF